MRLLVPTLAVLLLAGLIGCGGSSSVSFDDGLTSGDTTSGDTGNPPVDGGQVAAGSYSLTLVADRSDTTVNYGATTNSSAVASAGGRVIVDYQQNEGGALTQRFLDTNATSAGVLTGSLTIGTDTPRTVTGTSVVNSNGTYTLVVNWTRRSAGGSVLYTEKDTFTLTPVTP